MTLLFPQLSETPLTRSDVEPNLSSNNVLLGPSVCNNVGTNHTSGFESAPGSGCQRPFSALFCEKCAEFYKIM